MIDPTTVDPMPEQHPFWHRRDILTHIYDSARARPVSPWAVLGATMARAVAAIPSCVVLPPSVGSRTSVNLFVASVGASGAGKDAADAAAWELIAFDCDPVDVVPLGSGEGIARTFRPQGTKPGEDNPVEAAIFSAPEIDTWTALSGRAGATLTPELRKIYTGGTIGFGNAGTDTRNIVAAHSYRACLIIGVQPLRSGPLLDAADGGLPQRFVWLPALDPDAPDEQPQAPEPVKITTPDWDTAEEVTYCDDLTVLSVPDSARREIDTHRLSVLRGDPSVDPLDKHVLLTRLKVACGLMALEGRTQITAQDWRLAAAVMEVSRQTRESCQWAITEQFSKRTRARAMDAATREEFMSDKRAQRACEGTLRQLQRRTSQMRYALRCNLKGDIRDYFYAAMLELITASKVTELPSGPDGEGVHVDLRSPRSEQAKQDGDHRSTWTSPPPPDSEDQTGPDAASSKESRNGSDPGGCPCGRPGAVDPETGLCYWCSLTASKQ